jgi:ribosomal protein S24E
VLGNNFTAILSAKNIKIHRTNLLNRRDCVSYTLYHRHETTVSKNKHTRLLVCSIDRSKHAYLMTVNQNKFSTKLQS